MKSLSLINREILRVISKKINIQMSANNILYNDFSDEFNSSFFVNSCDDEYEFDIEQPEFFGRFQNNCPISGVNSNNEIPYELYCGFNNFQINHQLNGFNQKENHFEIQKDEEHQEISSVDGEKEFQPKVRKPSNDTNSTIELESSKRDGNNYEALFKLIEDKNLYEIGNGDDKLNTTNNVELIKLDKILSDSDTDLNVFIGDMLKSCPCDSLVKKQRIYKAKNIKRRRKSKSQIKLLEKEFKCNSSWSKDDIKRLSKSL